MHTLTLHSLSPLVTHRRESKRKQTKQNIVFKSKKKEVNPVICSHMDGLGEQYAKRNKPDTEGQILHDLTYKIYNSQTFGSENAIVVPGRWGSWRSIGVRRT